jgi:hypothetical protein
MGVINRDDIPVAIKDDNVEVRLSEVGDMTVSFIRLQKGTDLGPALAGLPDDLCPCPHWGYMFRGRLTMKTRNGDEVYEAGKRSTGLRATRPPPSRTASTWISRQHRSSRR